MKPILLALHGLPRAGKDTLASVLITQHGYHRVAFADAGYRELAEVFGVREKELRSDLWKREPQNDLAIWHADNPEYRALLKTMGEDMYSPRTSRYHMQRYLTEYRRAQDDFYWAKLTVPAMLAAHGDPIVVTDLRHPLPELPTLRTFAREHGYLLRVVEITRDGADAPSQHISDARLRDDDIDATLHNPEGRPADFIRAALDYLNQLQEPA